MAMKVDVSEIKTFRTCKRQWQLSSRNQFHLRPLVTPSHFALGTIFHESLHMMYMGATLETVMQFVRREISQDSEAALLAMVPGYYKQVLPGDLERYTVLDIEHHFEIEPKWTNGELVFPRKPIVNPKTGEITGEEPGLLICGSIDMIVIDEAENAIYGFEHKTCKNFRDSTFMWMDEQPRVYTWAMQEYVRDFNEKRHAKWEVECEEIHQEFSAMWQSWDVDHIGPEPVEPPYPPEPEPATLGGVYINETKKLLRQFQYHRTLCKYPEGDQDNFMSAFFRTCNQCKHMVDDGTFAEPQPSYFGCKMCDFNTICSTYMYACLDKDKVLEEFKEEFKVRDTDHLEEKTERSVEK